MASSWDRDLAELALDYVNIHAGSLTEAWQALSVQYLVRSVLVVSDRALKGAPFDYQSAKCTVRELYDALAATYGLVWEQDARTGVAWFHPRELTPDPILTTNIRVEQEQLGLPLQTGILEPLAHGRVAGLTVKRWGSLFRNTFDYAVDVRAGVYSVRDLLNLCCVANPTKTFFAQVGDGGVFLTPVSLASDEVRPAPVGALHLWDAEIGQARPRREPTRGQVMAALADKRAEVRHAARNYLEAIIWSVNVDELVRRGSSIEQTLWACIGVTSVLVRSEEATHQASLETMGRLATDDFLAMCEPELAVMTALECARLTQGARALEIISKRKFVADELAPVISDACRVASSSDYVRQALRAESAAALVNALRPLAAMIRLPDAGKLQYTLASAL